MDILTEWITNIILFILLATIIDLLLPNSSMQKYTKLVIGLLLIIVILTPILKLLSTDLDELFAKMTTHSTYILENDTENLIESKKKEIQASQRAYILKQAAVQLKDQVEEELREQYGLMVKNIEVEVKDEVTDIQTANIHEMEANIEIIKIELEHASDETDETAIQVVKPVHIDTSRPKETAPSSNSEDKIATFLSERWQLHSSIISVAVEGGD